MALTLYASTFALLDAEDVAVIGCLLLKVTGGKGELSLLSLCDEKSVG